MKHFSARRRVPPAQQGLTLIGQMMVLLVAGVLGAVALSSWLDLQVRERATEAYNQMEAIKPAANALGQEQRGEPWPASLSISTLGALPSGSRLQDGSWQANASDRVLTLSVQLQDVGRHLDGQRLLLKGWLEPDGSVNWVCASDVDVRWHKQLPAPCQYKPTRMPAAKD